MGRFLCHYFVHDLATYISQYPWLLKLLAEIPFEFHCGGDIIDLCWEFSNFGTFKVYSKILDNALHAIARGNPLDGVWFLIEANL